MRTKEQAMHHLLVRAAWWLLDVSIEEAFYAARRARKAVRS